jgi:hypothetical protein
MKINMIRGIMTCVRKVQNRLLKKVAGNVGHYCFCMSSLSHDVTPRILCLVLADVWKTQGVKFVNTDVLSLF